MFPRIVLIISLLFSVLGFAEENEKNSALTHATIVSQLKLARPDLEYKVVGPAQIKGLYEVQVANGPMLYVSADGNWFIAGYLYKVLPGQFVSMTDMRRAEMRKELMATADFSQAIAFTPPNGEVKKVIYVFTDVDCGYCRKFHREMDKINGYGIEVRYLAYPRYGIHSEGYEKLATVWCSENKQQAINRMKSGQAVNISVCKNNPVAEHYKLGGDMGVNGTPAILLEDGQIIPGYQPADQLAETLGLM